MDRQILIFPLTAFKPIRAFKRRKKVFLFVGTWSRIYFRNSLIRRNSNMLTVNAAAAG